ncbi:MAG: sigma-70 family RNA polymerase sigma factor [Clostridium sp.]
MEGVATIKMKILNFTKNKEIILVNKAIKGDTDSLALLVKENKEDLYRIAYSYVKNSEDAVDIIQECSYRAMLYISKLKNPEYFKTWITKIVINCSIDYLKTKNNELYFEDGIEASVKPKTISTDEKLDLHNAIDSVLITPFTIMVNSSNPDENSKSNIKAFDEANNEIPIETGRYLKDSNGDYESSKIATSFHYDTSNLKNIKIVLYKSNLDDVGKIKVENPTEILLEKTINLE